MSIERSVNLFRNEFNIKMVVQNTKTVVKINIPRTSTYLDFNLNDALEK